MAHANRLLPNLTQLDEIALLATAQVLWEMENPNMTLVDMEKHKWIKKWIPDGSYSNRHIFRNKVKIIDPRLNKKRIRKNDALLETPPNPPRLIPGIIITYGNDQFYRDFPRLKMAVQTIAKVILQIKPAMKLEQVLNHRLVVLYTSGAHPVLHLMVSEWIHEIILTLSK